MNTSWMTKWTTDNGIPLDEESKSGIKDAPDYAKTLMRKFPPKCLVQMLEDGGCSHLPKGKILIVMAYNEDGSLVVLSPPQDTDYYEISAEEFMTLDCHDVFPEQAAIKGYWNGLTSEVIDFVLGV